MINVLEKCNLGQLWNTDKICDTLKSKGGRVLPPRGPPGNFF